MTFDAAELLVSVLNHVLQHIFLLVFPFRKLLRWRGGRAALFFTASTIAACAASWVIWQLPTPFPRFLSSCCGLLFLFLICQCMTKCAAQPLLFAVLLQANYGDCLKLVVRVTSLFSPFTPISELSRALGVLILTVATAPFMYSLMRRYVAPILADREFEPPGQRLWIIPACFYIVFRLSVYPGYFPSDTRTSSPWVLLLLIWPIVTMMIYTVILRLAQDQQLRLALQAQLESDELLLSMQETLYAQQQKEMEQARIIRHDMRHHHLVVQRLLDGGESEEALRYLAETISTFDTPGEAECICSPTGRTSVPPEERPM